MLQNWLVGEHQRLKRISGVVLVERGEVEGSLATVAMGGATGKLAVGKLATRIRWEVGGTASGGQRGVGGMV